MKDLKKTIEEYQRQRKPLWHFNVGNWEQLAAVVAAAKKARQPVIIGVSESERRFWGVKIIAALVKFFREKEKIQIFLNADHTRTLAGVREAAEAGYDLIVFDASHLPYVQNIKLTRQAVQIAKKIKKDVLVEGELGYIGGHSKIFKKIPKCTIFQKKDLPSPALAADFVKRTGVDLLAPACGNIHGRLAHGKNPRLAIDLIKAIKKSVKIPLVLHGGSGISPEDLKASVKAGISVIHISTDLRVIWRRSLEDSLRRQSQEIAPQKINAPVIETLEKWITKLIK